MEPTILLTLIWEGKTLDPVTWNGRVGGENIFGLIICKNWKIVHNWFWIRGESCIWKLINCPCSLLPNTGLQQLWSTNFWLKRWLKLRGFTPLYFWMSPPILSLSQHSGKFHAESIAPGMNSESIAQGRNSESTAQGMNSESTAQDINSESNAQGMNSELCSRYNSITLAMIHRGL